MSSYYGKKLISDLPEQFKGKERIEAFMTVVGKQLDEVLQFYTNLNDNRSLSTAEGIQLDKIGSIVGLTRAEASALMTDGTVEMDDDRYRSVLIYKIMLNTSTSTYYDIVTGMKQFYNVEASYSESVDEPATIRLDMGVVSDIVAKIYALPYIKAGGVQIIISESATGNMQLYFGEAIAEEKEVTLKMDSISLLFDEEENALSDENDNVLSE